MPRMIRVHRKSYKRKDGTRVKAATYLTKDKGAPGRTHKSEVWYEHGPETGWKKDMPADKRRRILSKAYKGDYLKAARAKQALANVNPDPATRRAAKADAKYFFDLHARAGR